MQYCPTVADGPAAHLDHKAATQLERSIGDSIVANDVLGPLPEYPPVGWQEQLRSTRVYDHRALAHRNQRASRPTSGAQERLK